MADLTRRTENLIPTNISDWEQGGISSTDGTDTVSTIRLRTIDFYPINNNTDYYISVNDTDYCYVNIILYDSSKQYAGQYYLVDSAINGATALAINVPSSAIANVAYYRAVAKKRDDSTITAQEITDIKPMLNLGSTAQTYEPYWQHSLRKLTTATEAVENPLYSDGTAITAYTLKGNEEHTGTPSPQNPVMPQGTGNKTANLFDYKAATYGTWTNSNGSTISAGYAARSASLNAETITVSCNGEAKPYSYSIVWLDGNDTFISREHVGSASMIALPQTFTPPTNAVKYYMQVANGSDTSNPITESQLAGYKFMLNKGSTAQSYEPYGYKIPISSGQTVNNYLGSIQSTRQIQKLELTGNEDWNISLGVFYLGTLTNDYLRSTGDITYISTHYQPYQQQSSAGSVPDGYFGFGNSTAVQRLYVHDSNYSTVDTFKAYLQAQYAAGTPVTVWYVLATATTGIVNEPLMKIDTYADSISDAAAIPTTEGANSITVDTTVQPSEFTATWTGWHDSSVKEYDGTNWQ